MTSCRPGEPKVLQPTSDLEYGKRLLRGRPQQPSPKAPKAAVTIASRRRATVAAIGATARQIAAAATAAAAATRAVATAGATAAAARGADPLSRV